MIYSCSPERIAFPLFRKESFQSGSLRKAAEDHPVSSHRPHCEYSQQGIYIDVRGPSIVEISHVQP
jgi:hypothetical protein